MEKVNFMTDSVPDSVKVAVSVAAPSLNFMGISVEDWTYILSAVVSLLFILEKTPMLISRITTFIKWIKRVKKS